MMDGWRGWMDGQTDGGQPGHSPWPRGEKTARRCSHRQQLTPLRHSVEHTSTGPVWRLSMLQSNERSGRGRPDPCSQPTPGTHRPCTRRRAPPLPRGVLALAASSITRNALARTDAPGYPQPVPGYPTRQGPSASPAAHPAETPAAAQPRWRGLDRHPRVPPLVLLPPQKEERAQRDPSSGTHHGSTATACPSRGETSPPGTRVPTGAPALQPAGSRTAPRGGAS